MRRAGFANRQPYERFVQRYTFRLLPSSPSSTPLPLSPPHLPLSLHLSPLLTSLYPSTSLLSSPTSIPPPRSSPHLPLFLHLSPHLPLFPFSLLTLLYLSLLSSSPPPLTPSSLTLITSLIPGTSSPVSLLGPSLDAPQRRPQSSFVNNMV